MKNNINEIYVVNQPRKPLLSVVFVSKPEYPLPQDIHDELYLLSEETDIIFVFHSDAVKGINPDKFCNLYSGCGWILADSIVDSFIKTIEYSENIFKSHGGVLIYNDVYKISKTNEITRKSNELLRGGISSPVFVPRRLSSEEIYDIYKITDSGTAVSRMLGSIGKKEEDVNDRKYSIWTSNSDAIYMKLDVASKILCTAKEDYTKTFTWEDIRYFIASTVQRARVNVINSEVDDLDINSLYNDAPAGEK